MIPLNTSKMLHVKTLARLPMLVAWSKVLVGIVIMVAMMMVMIVPKFSTIDPPSLEKTAACTVGGGNGTVTANTYNIIIGNNVNDSNGSSISNSSVPATMG